MCGSGLISTLDSQQYLAAVERREEIARLQAQAQRRESMLIFGPEGVGKTRLLDAFVKTQPLALHVPKAQTPREILQSLLSELRRSTIPGVHLPADRDSLNTASIKGIVQRALELADLSPAPASTSLIHRKFLLCKFDEVRPVRRGSMSILVLSKRDPA
jgi:hypothetical protein